MHLVPGCCSVTHEGPAETPLRSKPVQASRSVHCTGKDLLQFYDGRRVCAGKDMELQPCLHTLCCYLDGFEGQRHARLKC